MTPSKQAIEAVYEMHLHSLDESCIQDILQTAYAVDFASLQQENERLKKRAAVSNRRPMSITKIAARIHHVVSVFKFPNWSELAEECAKIVQEEEIDILQQENERLKADVKDLIWSGCQTDQVAALVGEVGRQRTVLRELAEALKLFIGTSEVPGPKYEGCRCRMCQAGAALSRAEEVLK